MIDEELDPQTDPVMARLRRAMPAHLREMPSATDPAAQALMKGDHDAQHDTRPQPGNRAQASDETASFVTDARSSDLGVPQAIDAPENVTVVDPSVPELFDVMAAVPEVVLDECIPDVEKMSDLSDADFGGLVDCLRNGGAEQAADIFADLGPAGLDATAVPASTGIDDTRRTGGGVSEIPNRERV